MLLREMGERLMVHPAAVTNATTRLEQRGLARRQMSLTTGASSTGCRAWERTNQRSGRS
jgi:DNA-binding MarR family transcriptional regulator